MKKDTALFVSSLGLALFWLFVNQFKVYDNALLGAVVEMLWLVMLLLLVVLPVLGILLWRKQHWKFPSFYFFSLLLNIGTIGILIYYS
ncbi:MAG: hypothetical protein RL427_757 [Bacteroidota bacterium]|jgi:hypothetical protein